eukprot:2685331-Amphidinium_carterae.1
MASGQLGWAWDQNATLPGLALSRLGKMCSKPVPRLSRKAPGRRSTFCNRCGIVRWAGKTYTILNANAAQPQQRG